MLTHYNRINSDRTVLPAHLNHHVLYWDYKKINSWRRKRKSCFSSIIQKIFNEFHIGLHRPKKNNCTLCEEIRNKKKVGVLKWLSKVQRALEIKEGHKREHQKDVAKEEVSKPLIFASFDLQQALLTPHSDSTLLYRVIHKSLRDFRTRLRNNQDRHGRKELINR